MTRSEVRLGSLEVRDTALGDGREDESLTCAQRDIAVAEVEVAGEGDIDALADPERAVGLDLDGEVGREKREAVGMRGTREGERDARDGSQCKKPDEETTAPRPRSGRLQGCSRGRNPR